MANIENLRLCTSQNLPSFSLQGVRRFGHSRHAGPTYSSGSGFPISIGIWVLQFTHNPFCFAAPAGSHQRNGPCQEFGTFSSEKTIFPLPLSKPMERDTHSKQLGLQRFQLLRAGWSAEHSPTVPDKSSSLQQSMAAPLRADKTLSTVSRFISPLWAQGIKHSCQTQINV